MTESQGKEIDLKQEASRATSEALSKFMSLHGRTREGQDVFERVNVDLTAPIKDVTLWASECAEEINRERKARAVKRKEVNQLL